MQHGDGPVVLLSAGIGATPVLAMLHALAAGRSAREIWWLYGARSAADHPFAREARDLAAALPHCRSFIAYSKPAPGELTGMKSGSPLKLVAKAASKKAEREMVLRALERTHWNRKQAARDLQISYKSLLHKIKQIGGSNGKHLD